MKIIKMIYSTEPTQNMLKLKCVSQDQNSQPLEIEDRINLTMVIKWRLQKWDIQLNREIEYL